MDWTRGPAVGRGSSATVYLATTISSGHQFAVKSSDLSSSAQLQNEHALLSNLNSPYLINCLGFEVEIGTSKPPVFNLFVEYLPEGTLWDAIQSHGGRIEESKIGAYSRQILSGLEYLHANGIAHCDIKSRNLLLSGFDLKIADLGCAKFLDDSGNGVRAFSGSPAFMAPEVARGEEQGFPADIWAFGCTVIEMATGDHPWQEMEDPVSALYRIGFSDDSPEVPRRLSETARDFVAKCLIKEPRERWTAKRLLEHPFLHGFDSESVIECSKMNTMSSSPSCVLDQSFWSSSMEDLETPLKLTHQASPAERIRSLAGNLSSDCGWEGDDRDWILIRNNGAAGGSHGNGFVSSEFSATFEEDEEDVKTFNLEFEGDSVLFCLVDDDFSIVNSENEGLEREFESDFMLENVKFGGSNDNCSSSFMQSEILLPRDLLLLLLCFQNFKNPVSLLKNLSLIKEEAFDYKIYHFQNHNVLIFQKIYIMSFFFLTRIYLHLYLIFNYFNVNFSCWGKIE